jgi:hypothetical protein
MDPQSNVLETMYADAKEILGKEVTDEFVMKYCTDKYISRNIFLYSLETHILNKRPETILWKNVPTIHGYCIREVFPETIHAMSMAECDAFMNCACYGGDARSFVLQNVPVSFLPSIFNDNIVPPLTMMKTIIPRRDFTLAQLKQLRIYKSIYVECLAMAYKHDRTEFIDFFSTDLSDFEHLHAAVMAGSVKYTHIYLRKVDDYMYDQQVLLLQAAFRGKSAECLSMIWERAQLTTVFSHGMLHTFPVEQSSGEILRFLLNKNPTMLDITYGMELFHTALILDKVDVFIVLLEAMDLRIGLCMMLECFKYYIPAIQEYVLLKQTLSDESRQSFLEQPRDIESTMFLWSHGWPSSKCGSRIHRSSLSSVAEWVVDRETDTLIADRAAYLEEYMASFGIFE